ILTELTAFPNGPLVRGQTLGWIEAELGVSNWSPTGGDSPRGVMPEPLFLSLDGLDGTGKSTQCRLLVDWLAGQKIPVTACTDPGGTAIGQELRKLVLFGREHRIAVTTEALLFMASRAQLVEEVIRPALARGEVGVAARF